MHSIFKVLCGAAGFCTVAVSGAGADSVSTGYDIRLLMGKPHPFAARPAQPAAQPTYREPAYRQPTYRQPAAQPIARPVYAPAPLRPRPRPAAQPVSAPASQPQAGPAPSYPSQKTGPLWPGGTERGARASSRGNPLGGIISEISVGALMHDKGPFSNTKEDGYDAHIEIRFASPGFLDVIWSPEPHIGANINSDGDTSQVFAGLSYEWNLWQGLFAGISVGGAVHDGETDSGASDKKDLGCHLLFRESLTLGWQITDHHKIAAVFDHISNAKICSHNEGLENLGVRYSYRF